MKPEEAEVNRLTFEVVTRRITIEQAADRLVGYHQGDLDRRQALVALTGAFRIADGGGSAPSW